MRKLTYLNSRGESIEFSVSPLFINSLVGVNEADANVQTSRAPFQDGATYIDTVLEPRYPVLDGSIVSTRAAVIDEQRRRILRVCNPKLGLGKLSLEVNGVVKEIYGAIDGVPAFPDKNESVYQRFMISWVCPSPFWQDINPTMMKLEDFVGNFHFPISFPASFSIRGDEEQFMNDGHVPTPVKVTFRGEAVNPMITKVSTGEFIRVKRTIPAEHSLVITTDFNSRTVRIVDPYGKEMNAMGYIDLNSTFFSLDVGENNLSFITDGGNPEVFIEYRNMYLGV